MIRKLFRHPNGSIEDVTFLEAGPTAQAFYVNSGFVEIPFPQVMPPAEDRDFWEAPDGVLQVNASAKAAHAAVDRRTMGEKIADILLGKGVITPAEADDIKARGR